MTNRRWNWVEDDFEVVVFTGPYQKCRSFFRKWGGDREGLHLMSGLVVDFYKPEIGKTIQEKE